MAKKKDADQHESAEHTASAEKATTPEQANHVVFDPFAIPDLPLGDLLRTDDLVKQESDSEESEQGGRSRRRRGGESRRSRESRRSDEAESTNQDDSDNDNAAQDQADEQTTTSRRRRRRRRGTEDMEIEGGSQDDPPGTVTRVRAPRSTVDKAPDKVTAVRGSTRLEAKRQRRRESRDMGRRRHGISEAEFLARRESMDRKMVVREDSERIQIGVLEDDILVEHFVSHTTQDSLIGNVYLGRVQNVLPSMEAAFVDIGRGRNAVLYAGEVNWDAAQLDGQAKRIENALKSGDSVLVQVTKDPVGHKGARLTSQISLPGRYLVYVPGGSMTGISRKLPEVERTRLKRILREHTPDEAGVIVRTAAEGASEEELMNDINRLRVQWEAIEKASKSTKTRAPELLYAEPDLTIKTVRDVFNEDFSELVVQGEHVWDTIEAYVTYVAPDLLDRLSKWEGEEDVFDAKRINETLAKALDRKVNLPSGGSLVIDRTEAMTVIDVNTGKFTGTGGNLEETVTKNNLEAAEEVVRQLRLRDIGGIIVIDFIDMVLEANRDLVLRRLVECLARDRTKHQVSEVTSLGLVQMTRKRVGTGLVEVFSTACEACSGRGIVVHDEPLVGGGGRQQHVHRPSDRPTRSERRKARQMEREAQRDQRDEAKDQSDSGSNAEPTEQDREREKRAAATREALTKIAAASQHGDDEGQDVPEQHDADAGDVEAKGSENTSEDGGAEGRSRRRRRGRRGRGGRGRQQAEGNNEKSPSADSSEPTKSVASKPAKSESSEPKMSQPAKSEGSNPTKQDETKSKTASVEKSLDKPEISGRRRRRAAGSAQGSKTAATVETRVSSGSRVSSTQTASDTPKQKETEVTMLGVGVSADQIKRG
ncbi:Rne/Rng family ribonuclease [Pseudoglutamicibacter cumminsii]|uniref:Rne/Rng family ribonuclease n=1 Tax=Pseudoglutamicibacter cumminsii TaxID=156979 RepID=UPI0019597B42|nr:Rne/Rng family ribonuclease [Pseudoglutamicibacter cumminsii]MBM7796912.1 ribonuclease E [Pseudoglutamicibacter cumminsii]